MTSEASTGVAPIAVDKNGIVDRPIKDLYCVWAYTFFLKKTYDLDKQLYLKEVGSIYYNCIF